jgi:flagellin-like protein
MKVSTKKNDGVSPVIGTILLVAITVVLVAIISAVVMGMTGDIGASHVVGVKVVQGNDSTATNGSSLLVTITGGDTTGLTTLTVYNGSTLVEAVTPGTIGVPVTVENATTKLGSGATSISVIGTFSDGNQTIYTGTINLV